MSATVRVELPANLCLLAGVHYGVDVALDGLVTQRAILDELEARYPMLRGTIRDHTSKQRRAFIRFFACEEDLSHASLDDAVPEAVAQGKEPFLIIGAIAGG
jgi:hypothetical protein